MPDMLRKCIDSCSDKIGIIGFGYVGLPLVVEFAKANYSVSRKDVRLVKLLTGVLFLVLSVLMFGFA